MKCIRLYAMIRGKVGTGIMKKEVNNMKFTMDDTLQEILADSFVDQYLDLTFQRGLLQMVAPVYYEKTIAFLAEKCRLLPLGLPFPAKEFLKAVNRLYDIKEGKYRIDYLWKEGEKEGLPDIRQSGKKKVCLISKAGEGKDKPAVIISPGGAYELLSCSFEGFEMADKMEEAGYRAFVLFYRVKPDLYPAPMQDIALAVKHIRKFANDYGINPENVMCMGSSAGGHLSACLGAIPEVIEKELTQELLKTDPEREKFYRGISCKPDKLCLNYSVNSFMDPLLEPCFVNLAGERMQELRSLLSPAEHVDENYPKCFLWACADDDLVPCKNTEEMAEKLKEAGVSCEVHIFPEGGHGRGLAEGSSAQEWPDRMIKFMK